MASSSNGDWCTIESDPGVFTCLVETLGTRNVEFAELWGLDDDSLRHLVRPTEGGGADDDAAVHGLIFLFKWQSQSSHHNEEVKEEAGEGGSRGKPLTGDDVPEGLFFARQVTHNACATQAILSVLFNAPGAIVDAEGENDDENENENENENNGDEKKRGDDDDGGKRLVLGRTLSNFKSFTMGFPPDLRGEAIGSSDEIRSAHNSFGRAEDAFLSDPSRAKRAATDDDDDVFHFIAYVPREEDGCVYELDGLQPGPIRVGSYKKEDGGEKNGEGATMDWIRVARDAIQSRLANYPTAEIKFNLMATVQDRRTCLSSRLDALAAIGVEESDPAMLAVRAGLSDEEAKRGRWAMENARRRHNYLPFCVELLRGLAGSGKFESLVERARESAGEKRKRAEEWKKRSSSSGGE